MKAKIYKPAKSAMQSGRGKSQSWILEYESPSARRPESLMGWTQSGDTLNQVKLKFPTAEEASKFAEEQGMDYIVLPERTARIKPRNYVDNFRYIPPQEAGGK